jgi:hypothetical protein
MQGVLKRSSRVHDSKQPNLLSVGGVPVVLCRAVVLQAPRAPVGRTTRLTRTHAWCCQSGPCAPGLATPSTSTQKRYGAANGFTRADRQQRTAQSLMSHRRTASSGRSVLEATSNQKPSHGPDSSKQTAHSLCGIAGVRHVVGALCWLQSSKQPCSCSSGSCRLVQLEGRGACNRLHVANTGSPLVTKHPETLCCVSGHSCPTSAVSTTQKPHPCTHAPLQ